MPPATRPALVSCAAVGKSYGGPLLFEGLTFVVHEGDHIGLVGPNGAGKSTFLKILGGVEDPDSGTCTRRKNLRIGYVAQTPVFARRMTAAQVVAEGAATDAHLDDHEREERVRHALRQARFADPEVPADSLSGGWKARLALARELARAPDLLLLDEPTNHLDVESILWLETLLRNASTTFVVVSHDRYFLDRVCTRLLVIEGDRLEAHLGNYSDWRRRVHESRRPEAPVAQPPPKPTSKPPSAKPPSASTAAREADKDRERERRRLARRVETLEADVSKLEAELAAVRAELAADHGGDWQKLHTLADRERELDALLAKRMAEWEAASAAVLNQSAPSTD